MKIDMVPGACEVHDGRLRAGPFAGSVTVIRERLLGLGLRPGSGPFNRVVASRHAQGLVLSCAGPGACGYFLDGDGLEASSSDLEAFLHALLPDCGPSRISGHYRVDAFRMIESDAIFWRDRGGISGSERREIVSADGRRAIITARVVGSGHVRDRVFPI